MKTLLLAMACVFWGMVGVYAQQLPSATDKADEFFRKLDFARAAILYEARAGKGPSETIYRRLAECDRHLGLYKEEEKWLKKLAGLRGASPEDLFMLGRSLESNQDYLLAIQYYTLCLQQKKPVRPAFYLQERIRMCHMADSIYTRPSEYEVHNERSLNSIYSDFGAVKEGIKIVFTSDRPSGTRENKALRKPLSASGIYGWTGRPFLKIFSTSFAQAERADTVAEMLNDTLALNRIDPGAGLYFHRGPVVFTANHNRIYYTRTSNTGTGLSIAAPGTEHPDLGKKKSRILFINHLEIWYADRNAKGWSKPHRFPYNDARRYSVGHPALSADEKTLFFSSDMPGTLGGMDIFSSAILGDSTFAKPVDLGKRINTTGNELFPSMQADSTLFFASDGRVGLGGLDIYHTRLQNGSWAEPVNMGTPVNSAGDDFDFQPFGSRSDSGFLASNRSGGLGNDDIYSFTRLRSLFLKVYVKNLVSSKTLYRADVGFQENARSDLSFTNIEGYTYFKVMAGAEVALKGSHEGYYDTTARYLPVMPYSKKDTLETTVYLREKKIYKEIDDVGLDKLYYDFNKSTIRPDAVPILDRLTALLNKNPLMRIRLSSHTDSRGSDAYNLKLSARRAKSAVNYLIAHGISRLRLIAKGYGETVPVNECINGVKCSEAAFQLNRRTEITILK